MQCVACFGGGQSAVASGTLVDTARGSTSAASKASSPQPSSGSHTSAILDRPADLCVSPDGLIYVVDFGGSCIRVF